MSWSIGQFCMNCDSMIHNLQGSSPRVDKTFYCNITVSMQVSQSHDLLAEILQLSSSLPAALRSSGGKYSPILSDFRFFRDPDAHEGKIEASQDLTDLDEEFREVWTASTSLCS